MVSVVKRLPAHPRDGQVVADKYGSLWQFSAARNTWLDRGTVREPPDVSESQNGLVVPAVFRKLQRLRGFYEADPGRFQPLKLDPGVLAYWYYFRSADKLFKFSPEGDNGLRIEIDRGRIYQILRKQVCPGGPGPRGDQGDKGPEGDGGAPEGCWVPSAVERDKLDFAIFVPTPIRTPISLRLHRASPAPQPPAPQRLARSDHLAWWSDFLKRSGFTNPLGVVERQLAELRALRQAQATGLRKLTAAPDSPCNIPLCEPLRGDADAAVELELVIDPASPAQIIYNQPVPSLQLDQNRTGNSLMYDQQSRVLCGSLFLAADVWGDPGGWCLKARQVGPDGPAGPDGRCGVSLAECLVVDSPLLATCPIVSLRADCEEEVLYWLCSELLPERCVDRLQLAAGSAGLAADDALKAGFAAAQVTTEQCKRVYQFRLDLPADEIPQLQLDHWEPQPGCVSKRNYDRHKFDWIPATDLPACNPEGVRWYGPADLNPTKFPWSPIVQQPPEQDECCSDSMFYCPNSQQPGGLCPEIPKPVVVPPGGPPPPPPPPTQPPPPPPPAAVTCIKLELLDDHDRSMGSVTLVKSSDNWNYTALTRLYGGSWRGCQMLSVLGAATSVAGGNVPPPPATCCVNVPVTFELGKQFNQWALAVSCPVVPVLPPEVPTPDRNSAFQTGNWDCTNYRPPTYAEAPGGHSWVGIELLSSQVTFNLDNPRSLVGNVFSLPTTGLGGNLAGAGWRKAKVVECTPAPPPPPRGSCLELKLESSDGLVMNIALTKVPNHYDWGSPDGILNPPAGPAWRGCIMYPVWGSDTANGRACNPPNPAFDGHPRNISVPLVVEILNSKNKPPGGDKGVVVCWLGTPVCTVVSNNGVPTNLKSQCGRGSGEWSCGDFSPTIDNISTADQPHYCGYLCSYLPQGDLTTDLDSLDGKVFQVNNGTVGVQYLFGLNTAIRPTKLTVVKLPDGSCVDTPPPPLPPPPPPGPDQYGCSDGKQPCGQILFTGVGNTGQGVANTVLIRDPLGDTLLHPLTMDGVSVWRGCSIRVVPFAWVGASLQGTGGVLRPNVPVPVAYDLYCYPYPDDLGRPTPSPATGYPTQGFYLRMFWPIRTNGETMPCAGRSTPDVTFGCATCIPGGDCPAGSIQGDWYYPDYAVHVNARSGVCGPRPLVVGFQMVGVGHIFGRDNVIVSAVEQNYSGQTTGGGPMVQSAPRMGDDLLIPIVRI